MHEVPAKKILIVLPHTGSGGDSRVILSLLSALPAHTLEFHILTSQRGDLHPDFARYGQLYTFPLDDPPIIRRILRRFFMSLFVGLKRRYGQYLIKKFNPDLIYVNTVNEHEFSQAALHSGRKLIVHPHEMGFVVTQRMRSGWIEQLLSQAHAVISPAVAVSAFYRDVFGADESKMRVIHETVSDARLQHPLPGPNLRERLGIGPDTLLIGSVGSVIYRKGVDTFLSALLILRDKLPAQQFVFLWLGGNREILEKQTYYRALQKSIARHGLADRFLILPQTADVVDFYAELDIFVLPSRMEAFPLVVLEALLSKKPVVAMDVAGVREVIDPETGYLVKDRTPEGLAEGILYFLESGERRKEAGRKGRQRVLENFEANVQAPKWLKILDNL